MLCRRDLLYQHQLQYCSGEVDGNRFDRLSHVFSWRLKTHSRRHYQVQAGRGSSRLGATVGEGEGRGHLDGRMCQEGE